MIPNAQYLREKFWENDALKGSPIGKPYKEIEYVTGIPVLASGKRKTIVNEWKK